MKNTSILIPIILIGCLVALGYLFFRAFQTADDDRLRTNRQIVLDERDYTDEPTPEDLGTRADYEETTPPPAESTDRPADRNAVRGESGDGFDELTPAERDAARRAFEERQRQLREDADVADEEEAAAAQDEPATTSPPASPRRTEPSGSGRYLVIAGSFRQEANARDRVTKLKEAGFADTRIEPFNRGTYAVALAGQSDSYNTANALAQRVRAAGFEVEVMRRR